MLEAKNDGDIAMTYLTVPTVLSLLTYAATVDGEEWIPLENENRINVAFPKFATLIKLEAAMIRYNFGFLFDGTLQEVLGVLRDSQQDT